MTNSTTLDKLPLEVLHHILYFLDVPVIGKIRQVSRYLNEATHYRNVWRDAYRGADFVRPPGPFPSQTVSDLENALISNFRIGRNLRHAVLERGSSRPKLRRIQHVGTATSVKLVFGRYLLVALRDDVRCYDLDVRKPRPSIIYRSDGTLRGFECVSATDPEGRPFACAVVNVRMKHAYQMCISIYSLNVGEKSNLSLDLLHQSEHNQFFADSVRLGPRAIIIQSEVGDVVIAMDVHARTLFLVPSFTRAVLEAVGITEHTSTDESIMPTSISTSTHLILASSFCLSGGWRTFFQVFAIPPSDAHRQSNSTSIPLVPSHSGTIFGIKISGTVLLHDSILDSTTQDVLIAIRALVFIPPEFSSQSPLEQYGMLRLSTSPASFGPKGGTITFQPLGSFSQLSAVPFSYPSFNGTGRVFYSLGASHRIISALEYDVRASDDGISEEVKVVDYGSILQFRGVTRILDYDPYSCRICIEPAMKYGVIKIFDLAA